MAKFKPGNVVTEISGKVAGLVFTNTRSKPFVRIKKKARQKPFLIKGVTQQRVISLAKQWQSLPQSIQEQWQVATKKFIFTDRLSNTLTLSPDKLFIKVNAWKDLTGFAVIQTPPALPQYPIIESLSAVCTIFFFIVSLTPSFSAPTLWTMIYATRPMSPGISEPKKSDFKFIRFFGSATLTAASIGFEYQQIFRPSLIRPGQVIFLKARHFEVPGNVPGQSKILKVIIS